MPDFSEEGLDHYLLNQVRLICCYVVCGCCGYPVLIIVYVCNCGSVCEVDLRHRTVSRRVEEVLTVLRDLTTEVSKKDGRFQSIAHAGVNNENIKATQRL